MLQAETYGVGGYSSRRLHLVSIPRDGLAALPAFPVDDRCAVLVLWDATDQAPETIAALARVLLSRGAVYLCAWGPDCERVHDIFDEVLVGSDPPHTEFPDFVMTTWHANDPLEEALWYLLFSTIPDDVVAEACRDAVVVSIGNEAWSEEARLALRNPGAISERILSRGDAV